MKRALPYIITTVVGAAITVIIVCALKVWNAENTKTVMQILCDAFFVSGALIFGAGLLVFCSNGGAFYMLAYGVIRFFDLFRRGVKGKYKDFYEYSESKKENKHGFGFMLIVGLAFLAAAVAFLIAYNNL